MAATMAHNHATTEDLAALESRLGMKIEALERLIEGSEIETRRHFDVVAEKLLHDFGGALKDKISQHDDWSECTQVLPKPTWDIVRTA